LFNAFNKLAAVVQDRLEVAEMERRDRPLIVPGQAPMLLAAPADPDLTQLGVDPDLTLIYARP
jgi:hypothetical protein